MNANTNLPPGVTSRDISDPHECATCEGGGIVEVPVSPDDAADAEQVEGGYLIAASAPTQEIQCPDCGGLGVVNERVRS